jgi:hypothetical protein
VSAGAWVLCLFLLLFCVGLSLLGHRTEKQLDKIKARLDNVERTKALDANLVLELALRRAGMDENVTRFRSRFD